jgi:hypothetical protein
MEVTEFSPGKKENDGQIEILNMKYFGTDRKEKFIENQDSPIDLEAINIIIDPRKENKKQEVPRGKLNGQEQDISQD